GGLAAQPGLFVTPADPASNNIRVYAVSTAIRDVRDLPAEQAPTIAVRARIARPPLPKRLLTWLQHPNPRARASAAPAPVLMKHGPLQDGEEVSLSPLPDTAEAKPRRALPRQRLGELLLERGVITEDQLAHALSEKGDTGERLGHVLVRLGLITES